MPDAVPRWKPPRLKSPRTREQAHYTTSRWAAIRRAVIVRDAARCRVCLRAVGGRELHVDHILPLEDGGTDDLANLQVLCREHHGAKTIAEQRRRGFIAS
jgi:5-methylcytosine-specific restriction protein A